MWPFHSRPKSAPHDPVAGLADLRIAVDRAIRQAEQAGVWLDDAANVIDDAAAMLRIRHGAKVTQR
jgi:hypothetical protein